MHPEDHRLTKVLLGALVFVLGVQSMRFLFASTAWYLRDTVGIGTLTLIPIALAPFILGALIPIIGPKVGVRGSLLTSLWLLAGARTALQLFDAPAIDFLMAAMGTLAFVGILPALLSIGREGIVGGVLLGLAIDSSIKGLSQSLDLAYQTGLLPVAVVVVTAGAAVFLATTIDYMPRHGVNRRVGLLLLGLGPFLFVEFLILQNQGWISEMTGVGASTASLRIALLNVVALLAVEKLHRFRLIQVAAVVVVVLAIVGGEGDQVTFNILSLLAVPAAAMVWANLVPEPDTDELGASTSYLTAGAILFVVLGFAYYLPLDMNLGFDASDVRLAVALLFGILGLLAALRVPTVGSGAGERSWALAGLAAALPLFALVVVLSDDPEPASASGYPVRVASYNLHSAFNTEGVLDVAAIARVIEDTGATIVGLQEVPRGRLLSANTDLFALLVEELGFEYAEFFGTTDPTWGNAILSRFPITDPGRVPLPKSGTPMQRGYLGATIQVGNQPLLFISTHLQHVNDPDLHDEDPEADLYPVHHEQIETILREWGGRQPAVLVGDFNALPEWRQIEEILDAGWVDAWPEAGSGDGFTSSSDRPEHRIDYVFHTSSLTALDAGVFQSQASDHLPVVVDLDLP